MKDGKPQAFDLWLQADRDYPHDTAQRRKRYNELLREHGLIVERTDATDAALSNHSCGYWPTGARNDTGSITVVAPADTVLTESYWPDGDNNAEVAVVIYRLPAPTSPG